MLPERRGDLFILTATLLASAGWLFSKEAIQGLPPAGFVGWRFVLAALLLLPFCYRQLRQTSTELLLKAAATGLVMTLNLIFWIQAISHSEGIGEGAFIMSLAMLMVPPLAWLLFRERPSRQFWLALPIAIAGLFLLTMGSGLSLSLGQLLFLLASLSLALYFNLNSRFARRVDPMALTCVQLAVTGVMHLIYSTLFEHWPEAIEPEIWGWFAASVLLATSLRFFCQSAGQKYSNVANAALIMMLEPIWTVLISVFWYQEPMPIEKMFGCALILLALLSFRSRPLYEWYRNRRAGRGPR
ncbi:drug/metabolite transporter (DMT)-like permease [Oceanisphaera litoralis]|uniref:DMT family transporter n=1 Tax=Oceanisphaera litoralis TaxID=225144 RepID=UPI00195DB868|nr:DMT family transporter [Oceanisphaera litoralis]MBM7455242.1 drug/metabolite transporter (DMT)-like permease [Oceanisphaera litoralis]